MNHHIKTQIFKFLSILPNKAGNYLYHTLQTILNRNSFNHKIISSNNSFKSAVDILRETDIDISNKNMLEIGSGWAPIMPYYFFFNANVGKVCSYDINEHYHKKSIVKLNSYFESQYDLDIPLNKKTKYNLPDFISYYPNTDLAKLNTTFNDKVDFIFSRNVLEHITPDDILKIHSIFKSKFQHEFYILHMISPSDHRAYSDKSISLYDFLKYSKSEWNTIQTNFDYHNRLRLPQYIEIFKDLGYEIIYLNYDKCKTDSMKYKKFKALKLHEDFDCFSEEEILAGSINIVLKKPSQAGYPIVS